MRNCGFISFLPNSLLSNFNADFPRLWNNLPPNISFSFSSLGCVSKFSLLISKLFLFSAKLVGWMFGSVIRFSLKIPGIYFLIK